ncbi:Phenazine biosynthesis-like protein [Musa troglodytarum]|uniref:Phenazine biosynthesis-like protein n=2 Tax=Musa troglodytarum TaxID=320322 RepID=A0A9E7L0F5_9LILI|nr:Phenazine biosynthesis-like protein [Musa troglodytarum]
MLSVLHPPPLIAIQPRLLLRNAAPPAVLGLNGAKCRKRRGSRRRWIATGPEALRRAAVSFAAKLLGPPRADPVDLVLQLVAGGGNGGGGRQGLWGYGSGGWFGGWGRRRKGRGIGLIGLLASIAVAAALGMAPEKELAVGVTLLGFKNNRAWSRGIGVVALGFLICFLAWCGIRQRRDGRLKWIRRRLSLGYFLCGQAVDYAVANLSTFRLTRFDSRFKFLASSTPPFLAPMAKRAVRYAVIDAFTGSPFKGNPAAVCLLDSSSPEVDVGDEWMQSVASEFNISQTCFVSRAISAVGAGSDGPSNGASPPRFSLRWFTPVTEVKLCGHATLAAAHFLWTSGLVSSTVIEFVTKSGILTAKKVIRSNLLATPNVALNEAGEKFSIELDFPVVPVGGCNAAEMPSITETLNGASIVNVQKTDTSHDLIVELSSGKEVVDLHPNFHEIQKCAGRGLIVTAPAPPGSEYDIFTRFFCPKFGINEDPVCGSAHCALAPYWSKKLGKTNLIAYMASPRGGRLDLQLVEETQRILIQGEAVTVMVGSLFAYWTSFPFGNMGEGSCGEAPWSREQLNFFRMSSLMLLPDQARTISLDIVPVPGSEKSSVPLRFISPQIHYVQAFSNSVNELYTDAPSSDPRQLCTVPAGNILGDFILPISRMDAAQSYYGSETRNMFQHFRLIENPLLNQSNNSLIDNVSTTVVNTPYLITKKESTSDIDKALSLVQNGEVSTSATVPRSHALTKENSDEWRENTIEIHSREMVHSREDKTRAATRNRLRRARIAEGIKALQNSIPFSGQGKKESVLDDVIDYIKFLKHQLKVVSQSRLNGEAAMYPLVYVEGYGHFLLHQQCCGEPLEEAMGQLLESNMQAALDLLGSKGLIILPIGPCVLPSSH